MRSRGFTLVELLVAIIISTIILTAMAGMFLISNRTFRTNRDVIEISEDVRNAITTLEFIFSRWGVGVPCANNNCNIQQAIPNCNGQYPPQDPMCIDIVNNIVSFYANLYGFGFVVRQNQQNPNQVDVISCRLNTANNQNCYYVWNGGRVKFLDNNNNPVPVSLPSFNGQPDCINSPNPNLTINRNITVNNQNQTLDPGDYISRVPHRVRLYVQDGWLMMDREDMTNRCNDTERAVRIGRVQNFQVQRIGRAVRVDVTFVSADGRTYPITRIYGR